MRTVTALIVAAALIACGSASSDPGTPGPAGPRGPAGPAGPKGDPGDSAATMTSGSRLIARSESWVGEDGSRYLPASYAFHDNELDIDCVPAMASDGAMRCLPSDTATVLTGYFADASCTVPAAEHLGCLTAPRFAAAPLVASTCSAVLPGYLRIGVRITTIYAGTPCRALESPPLGAPYVWYATDGEAPPDTFVRFSRG